MYLRKRRKDCLFLSIQVVCIDSTPNQPNLWTFQHLLPLVLGIPCGRLDTRHMHIDLIDTIDDKHALDTLKYSQEKYICVRVAGS